MVKALLIVMVCVSTPLWAAVDPTAPLNWSKPAEAKAEVKKSSYALPKLQSIVCGMAAECQAILSGKVVSKGQSVSGYRVVKVETDSVTVARANKQWTLSLFSEDVKQ